TLGPPAVDGVEQRRLLEQLRHRGRRGPQLRCAGGGEPRSDRQHPETFIGEVFEVALSHIIPVHDLNVMSSVVDQTSTSRIRTVTRSPAPRATAAAERLAAATASNGYATTPVRGDGALVPARWRAGRLRGAAGRPAAGT